MSACSFNRLLKFVNRQLDPDGQMKVYDHLDRCDICRDAVYELSRDRDKAILIYRAYGAAPYNIGNQLVQAAGSLGVYARQ